MKEVKLRLERFDYNGGVFGFIDNKKILVYGALPNELVKVKICGKKKDYYFGDVIEIIEKSNERVNEKEDHYISCSPWQILREDKENYYKKELIIDLIKQNNLNIEDFDIEDNKVFYKYRNKLEFSFLDTEIDFAFFKRGTHKKKIKIDNCILGFDSINNVAKKILYYLKEKNPPANTLKSLILRGNRKGEVIASLFIKERKEILNNDIEIDNLKGISLYYSSPLSPASIKSELIFEKGLNYIKEIILNKVFYFTTTSFFQINIDMFEKTLLDMKNFVDNNDNVFDIYSGVGTIGISLDLKNVNFIESEKENILITQMNLEINGIRNFTIIEDRAENVISNIEKNSVLILDPPREGLHKKVIEELIKKEVNRIIYLSCNPLTQMRDLSFLSEKYNIIYFKGYNYFPRTPHIETLSILDRRV
ncbi:MAG: methyltransferase [Caldisericia bacterium]|nr:methyltransferase [Caldisericia bacterium]